MNDPSPMPNVNDAAFCAVGVDVGGTKIAAGLVVFPDGEVKARLVVSTLPKRGGEAVLQDVLRLVNQLSAQAAERRLHVAGIGVGVCELVDGAGNVMSAHSIGWQGLPVRERLSQFAPAIVEADVRAAALAEALFGAGRSCKCFLFVTVGTGISSCLVLDGKPFPGARGAAGTMASSPLGATCEKCGAAENRTLEEIASGPALVTRYNQRSATPVESGEGVLAAAHSADPIAGAVVRSAGTALGTALGGLVNVLDPEAVVIGGGLGWSGGMYWESLVASARQHIWSDLNRQLPIVKAATGPEAGMLGAAASAWRQLRYAG